MRLVIIFNLLIAVKSCEDFQKRWPPFPCAAADRCYRSGNGSYVEIFNNTLAIMCNNDVIDYDLMKCLSVENIQTLMLTDCYLSDFNVGISFPKQNIQEVFIKYDTPTNNFDSASFINMPSLKSVKMIDVRTWRSLNLSFDNVPSLTFLEIWSSNFTSMRDKIFEKLSNLSELRLTRGGLEELPADIFFGLRNLERLDLSINSIEIIHPSVFATLTQLKTLYLEKNEFSYLPADMLRGLSNLRELSISFNSRFSNVPSRFLKDLYNLLEFHVCMCNITAIDEDLFFEVINLTKVDLSSNKIERLPSKLFSNNKHLKVFRCSSNKISTIPEEFFAGLSELEVILLDENEIEMLPENLFSGLTSLKNLILHTNRITFIPENTFMPLENLEIISLSANNLSEISGAHPFGISKNLRSIMMNEAGLRKWPRINWAQHSLSEVSFYENHFETVKLPIFTPKRTSIDLYGCNIKTIYIDHSNYGFNMPTYVLGHNKITCDKELQPFIYTIHSNSKVALNIFPDIEYTTCYGEQRKFLDSSFDFIRNYCPINCKCYRENEEVKVNCSRRAMTKVPEVIIENATIVDLSNNNITELSNVDCQSWSRVTGLILNNNSLTDFPDDVLPSGITYLALQENHLTKLPPKLMEMIDDTEDFQIYLSKNNLTCDCDSLFTKDWLLRNKEKIMDFSYISCGKNSLSSFMEIISGKDCINMK